MLRPNPKNKVKEIRKGNGEDVEGRLDSISQIYTEKQTPVSRTHLFGPGMRVNVPKGRYDACS